MLWRVDLASLLQLGSEICQLPGRRLQGLLHLLPGLLMGLVLPRGKHTFNMPHCSLNFLSNLNNE